MHRLDFMSQPAAPANLNIRVFTQSGSKTGSVPARTARPLYPQERTSLGPWGACRQGKTLHAKNASPKTGPVRVAFGGTAGVAYA